MLEKKVTHFFYDIREEYNNAKRGRGLEWVEEVSAIDNGKKKLVVFNVLCRTLTLGNEALRVTRLIMKFLSPSILIKLCVYP